MMKGLAMLRTQLFWPMTASAPGSRWPVDRSSGNSGRSIEVQDHQIHLKPRGQERQRLLAAGWAGHPMTVVFQHQRDGGQDQLVVHLEDPQRT